MQTFRFMIAAVAIAAGTVAFAQDAVTARKDLMKAQGAAVKVLGDMAKGETAFDAAAAADAKAKLIETAAQIATVFEAEGMGGETKSKPEIWMMYDDFTAKADALTVAAEALDASSLDAVRAGMAGVGGACSACHQAYRI